MFVSLYSVVNVSMLLYSATPGRLNDLVMNRVVDLRSVTFLVGLAWTEGKDHR